MTDIAFHFNVPDKLRYGCRLLRKAYLSGAGVTVTGEPALLAQLDQWLWTFSATEFLPHAMDSAPAHQVAASAILLTTTPAASPKLGVLVNLGQQVPEGFEQFDKFIELVSNDADDRQVARSRWKHYAERGYAMKRHDLATTSGEGA